MLCNCNFLHFLHFTSPSRPDGRKYFSLKDEKREDSDLLMTLTGSLGGAPGLAADTPGAPPGTRPPAPAAASLGVGPPELGLLPTKDPRYSHAGPLHCTPLHYSAH